MIHKTLNVGPWRSPEAELSVLGDVTGRTGQSAWSNSIENKKGKRLFNRAISFRLFRDLKRRSRPKIRPVGRSLCPEELVDFLHFKDSVPKTATPAN